MRLISLLILSLSLLAHTHARPVPVEGIAAKAHGEIVTMSELNIKLAPIQVVLRERYPRLGPAYQKELKKIRDTILDDLIDRAIIFNQFKDRMHAIPDHLVEAEINSIIQNTYTGDKALFNRFLKAAGLTSEKFKQQQRKEILVSIVKSQQYGDLPPVTKAEINREYAKWKIPNRDREKDVGSYRKIYLPAQDLENLDATPEDQLELAEKIVSEIKAGKSTFEDMAKKHSRDAEAANGGLWKDVKRTDLPFGFGNIIFESTGKEVIGPVGDKKVGYTIFQVTERKYGPAKPLSSVRTEMEALVNNRKKKAEFDQWMKKLRSRKMIKKYL